MNMVAIEVVKSAGMPLSSKAGTWEVLAVGEISKDPGTAEMSKTVFGARSECELWLAAGGLEIGDKVIHTYRAGGVVPKGAWPYGGGRPVPLYKTVWSVVPLGKGKEAGA